MRFPLPRTLRTRLILMVLGVVVLPLAGVGLWLTRSAARSGEALLRQQLDATLDQVTIDVGKRWVHLRSAMLAVTQDTAVRRALAAGDGDASQPGTGTLVVHASGTTAVLDTVLASPMTLVSHAGHPTWRIALQGTTARPVKEQAGISVMIPVGDDAGRLEALVTVESLMPVGVRGLAGMGAVLQVTDRATGTSLSALPFDGTLMSGEGFELAGDAWLVRRKTLEEPAIIVAAAATLGPYTQPFKDAARKGSRATLAVSLTVLVLAGLATRRITHSLEELASATRAVADGDFDRRVSQVSRSEAGRVGSAFNTMTASLRTTLRQLSQRQALVAVGEFAASLAHEIRNPLTSIRIDLQGVEEELPPESPQRVKLGRALRQVRRLDQTVSGALRIARSGNVASEALDLRVPLRRAIESAVPAFESSGTTLAQASFGDGRLMIRGDEAALEQVFLNVLLNAAQALPPGGEAGVALSTEDQEAVVAVRDSGPEIPAEKLGRLFEPFFSTKPEGTGLGLAVARQIVTAHGGTIGIESAAATGTVVSIRLPLASGI